MTLEEARSRMDATRLLRLDCALKLHKEAGAVLGVLRQKPRTGFGRGQTLQKCKLYGVCRVVRRGGASGSRSRSLKKILRVLSES